RLRYLLHLLSLGRLDRENAQDLRSLLTEELTRAGNDIERQNELSALIRILNRYIAGEVDLMVHPEVIPSNIT
ncbi:MAG: hypothetical protein WA667_28760, partial [Candidatus Nitrosopolaris sp.]